MPRLLPQVPGCCWHSKDKDCTDKAWPLDCGQAFFLGYTASKSGLRSLKAMQDDKKLSINSFAGIIRLILVCTIAAHVAVNALNEYQDFHSGLDLDTRRTPFSGGSGILPASPQLAPVAFKISLIAMMVTVLSGLVIVYFCGAELLIPGLAGLALILLYTKVINRYPVLCLLSPGLGFGVLMVGGSYFALTGSYNGEVFLVSLIPFFLANNLLLLNQFPDVDADREAGRRHLLIQYGLQTGGYTYLLFLLLAALCLAISVSIDTLPTYSLLGLPVIAAGMPVFRAVSKYPANIDRLLPYMGINVGMVLIIPMLLGASLF